MEGFLTPKPIAYPPRENAGHVVLCPPCENVDEELKENDPLEVKYDSDDDAEDGENNTKLRRCCDQCQQLLGSPNEYMKKALVTHINMVKKQLGEKRQIPITYNTPAPVSCVIEDYFSKFIFNYFPDSWMGGIKDCICPSCEKEGTLSIE